jgi:hypothetical protein
MVKVKIKNKPNELKAVAFLGRFSQHKGLFDEGLCDLGMGFPELGYVSLQELKSLDLPFGLTIERDKYFEPDKTLAEYAEIARSNQRIVD